MEIPLRHGQMAGLSTTVLGGMTSLRWMVQQVRLRSSQWACGVGSVASPDVAYCRARAGTRSGACDSSTYSVYYCSVSNDAVCGRPVTSNA